jgi:hypothetical protein
MLRTRAQEGKSIGLHIFKVPGCRSTFRNPEPIL